MKIELHAEDRLILSSIKIKPSLAESEQMNAMIQLVQD